MWYLLEEILNILGMVKCISSTEYSNSQLRYPKKLCIIYIYINKFLSGHDEEYSSHKLEDLAKSFPLRFFEFTSSQLIIKMIVQNGLGLIQSNFGLKLVIGL